MKLRQMEERCGSLEQGIASLEGEIAGLEGELSRFVSTGETMRLSKLLDQRRNELSARMGEWEKATAELEAVKAL